MSLDVIELAKELIACESITPNEGGCMDVLQKHLEAMGFTVWREIFTEDGYEPTENLYARIGSEAPNLCYAGHIDVVPPGDWSRWTYPPFEPTVADGLLYGRGAEDMKGAIAAFVAALSDFLYAPHLTSPRKQGEGQSSPLFTGGSERGLYSGSISLLITADEEGIAVNGTQKMLQWLEHKGEKLDACLVGEPTNPTYLGEMMKVGRRGSLNGELIVSGKQGHVAYPHLADNPVTRLVNTLNEIQNYMLDEGTEFFPPSSLQVTTVDVGNQTTNLIPQTAQGRFNIRFNDQHSGESLEKWLRDVCDHWCGEGGYELACRVSGEAFLNKDEKLTNALVRAILDVTGHTPALSTTGGTSDARFIKDYCPVIEFGTTGLTAHQIDECVKVEVLKNLSAVYLCFLRAYFPE